MQHGIIWLAKILVLDKEVLRNTLKLPQGFTVVTKARNKFPDDNIAVLSVLA